MTTLTQVAITTRRAIRYSIYLVIFIILARALFFTGRAVYLKIFPPPPPPPTVTFGKLPKLEFPARANLPTINYTVETAEGELPKLSSQAKVYFMPKLSSHLLVSDVAKEKAAQMGFISSPEMVSETIYKFAHPRVPATLEINIVSGVFSISYDLNSDPTPLSKRPPTPEIAASQARSFLSAASLLPKDLTGEVTHEFLKTEAGNLSTALSLSEANLIKINFFRKAYSEAASLTPNPTQGNVWFIVSGDSSREKQIIAGEYHYFTVDETQFATYPIKTAQTAFDELKAGQGFISNLGLNTDGKITIRKVYLAYYDPGTSAQFYQPIIVFEGDRGFAAYVPAVTSTYYGD